MEKIKTPCEIIVWNIVPVIKKEFAKKLVSDYGLTQRETAKKLNTTEAAISRYISGKRGVLEITNEDVLNEIGKSTKIILKNNGKTVIDEICKICKIMKLKNLIDNPNSC